MQPRFMRAFVALSTLSSLSACGEAPGDRFEIDVAPLELAGIVEACYALTVTNAPGGAGDVVWTQDDICSTQYGDGAGAITYVGTCDANGNANTVILELTSLTASDGPAEFVNPCGAPDNAPCQLERPCVENTDTLVEFNLTIMRDANQGFFDVAVNFEDIFCSAKVDCDTTLLHGSDGERAPTVVVGLACTAGLGADTELYFGDLQLACDDGNVTLDIAGEPGNVYDGDAPAPIDQLATYRGTEQLTDDFGASWAKAYYTVAFALDLPTTKTCRLTGRATASDGPFDEPFTTPLETTYPVIEIDLPLTTAGATDYACDVHPIGDSRADGIWTRYTSLAGGEVFDVRARSSSGEVIVEEAHHALALGPANVTVRGGATQVFTATGGTPPYIFVPGGPGSFNGNVFTAANTVAATFPIRVYDDAGAMAQVLVTIDPTFAYAAASTTGLWYTVNFHTWVQAATPAGTADFNGVAFDGSRLVATTTAGDVLTSSDGRNYSLLTTVPGLGNDLQAVGTSFVTNGNNPQFSADAITWASAGITSENGSVTSSGGRLFFVDRPASCIYTHVGCATALYEGVADGSNPTGTWSPVAFTYADEGFNETPPRINEIAAVPGGFLLATSIGVFRVSGGVATFTLGSAWGSVVAGGSFALAVEAFGSYMQFSRDGGQSWQTAFGSAFDSSTPVVAWLRDQFFIAAGGNVGFGFEFWNGTMNPPTGTVTALAFKP